MHYIPYTSINIDHTGKVSKCHINEIFVFQLFVRNANFEKTDKF
jgi:hypothetical protein